MAKSRTKKKLEHEDDGDPWFNPYRWPASPRALDVVGDVLFDLEKRENRKRKRTAKDRQWLWQVGHVLVADLAYHYLSGSPGNGLVVPRAKRELGKKSRYHPPSSHEASQISSIRFRRLGYLRQKIGAYSGKRGTIEAHNNPSGYSLRRTPSEAPSHVRGPRGQKRGRGHHS